MRLSGRIAAVTAAGSGMGRAVARRLAVEGAHIVVVDRDGEAAQGTVDAIAEDGGSAQAETVDVAQRAEMRAMFDRIETQHGVLHVLHNHAGIPGAGGLDVDDDDWQRAVDVNMKSAFLGTSFAVPLLQKAGGKGAIVFTASVSGLVGSPLAPMYSMTKGGIVALGKSLALSLAPDIRVNVVCPGPVDTPMLPEFFSRSTEVDADVTEAASAFVASAIPLERLCRSEEIAEAVLFLASDASSYITGVALPVDGGYTAR